MAKFFDCSNMTDEECLEVFLEGVHESIHQMHYRAKSNHVEIFGWGVMTGMVLSIVIAAIQR